VESTAWDGEQAARYDIEHTRIDTPVTVRYLSDLAAGCDVLEFGAGTGRLAIPLAASCRSVVGIDTSEHMLAAAAKREVPPNVTFRQGDAASWTSAQRFGLVLCAFNLLLLFTTQEAQLAVICNAANHLAPGGNLVIENIHPPLRAFEEGERMTALHLPYVDVAISTQTLDWKSFQVDQSTLYITAGACRTRQVTQRMLFPAEQDLMARIAGLRLVKRMGNWRGTSWRLDPHGPSKSNVISTYQKVAGAADN
jgi:2-polyprenyl-3-methyl-5-hydroxy-6-metoxy-1,4-benzoquinol methylase